MGPYAVVEREHRATDNTIYCMSSEFHIKSITTYFDAMIEGGCVFIRIFPIFTKLNESGKGL